MIKQLLIYLIFYIVFLSVTTYFIIMNLRAFFFLFIKKQDPKKAVYINPIKKIENELKKEQENKKREEIYQGLY